MSNELCVGASAPIIEGVSHRCNDCGKDEDAKSTISKVTEIISDMHMCAECILGLISYAVKIKNTM